MTSAASELRQLLERSGLLLRSLEPAATTKHPLPGKWSPREIIGHLVDSASNNHQRFVRANLQDDLIFPGYEQDSWVALQRYQSVDWLELVTLWESFNRHIAHVMDAIPDTVRNRPHRKHNLHEIAWQTVPASQPTTLDYFLHDYVAHMRHHLRQILGASAV